jgi:ATP-dependent NAD(P)H-hydrate dehydratase
MVIDADGMWLVTQKPGIIRGCTHAVLTPNVAEFKRLAAALGVDESGEDALQEICLR